MAIFWILKLLLLQDAEASEDQNAKRGKPNEDEGKEKNGSVKAEEDSKAGTSSAGDEKQNLSSSKPPEPPKDYIHVRARRGQATDSHSLAERVRITSNDNDNKQTCARFRFWHCVFVIGSKGENQWKDEAAPRSCSRLQ